MNTRRQRFALALTSGLLLALLFPNLTGLHVPWLAPVALIPLLLAGAGETSWRWRLALGEVAGIVYWFGQCYWIQYVLAQHGGVGEAGGWASFLLFCVLKSIHLAVFACTAGFVLRTPWGIPAIAALWVAIERTHGPAGFAWLALGNAGQDYPLLPRLAPLVGVYGLSFVFALIGAAVTAIVLRRPRRELAWLALLLPLPLLPSVPEARDAKHVAVAVQPNLPDEMQWTAKTLDETVAAMSRLSLDQAQGADLIVWPEVPAPFYFFNDARFRDPAIALARTAGVPFLFGTVGYNQAGQPLNSSVLLNREGTFVDRYDKIFLVPFGEFVPPGFGWIKRISEEVSDFVPGERIVLFPFGADRQRRIAAFICYESAFPHLVRQFVRDGAQALFNLSNDGYFGHSAAREQHLLLVRMRALENRRWIVRATNDGITGSVDPGGRLITHLVPYERTAGRLPFDYEKETTLYSRAGDWFAWGCAPLALAAVVTAQRRRS